MDYNGLYCDILTMASRGFLIACAGGKNAAKWMDFVDECARFREAIRQRGLITDRQVELAVISTRTMFQR